MVPRCIDILPVLPKTPTQKIEKFRLGAAPLTSTTWDGDVPATKR